jgi:hypothetical protein
VIKIKSSEYVRVLENNITIDKIGKIDLDVIKDNSFYSLYYKFPLIERIILEIYKVIPGSNVEMYEQGKMKTINSIIDNNPDIDVLLPDIKEHISNYFSDNDNSPRNVIFHPSLNDTIQVTVDFEEINYIIAILLAILRNVCADYGLSNLCKIEHI